MGLPLKAALQIIGSNNVSDKVEKNGKTGELRIAGRIIMKAKTCIEIGICKVFFYKDFF